MEKSLSPDEYPSFYEQYIERVQENYVVDALQRGKSEMMDFLQNIPNDKLNYRYAEGKWTPKQVLLHVSDTERIFSFRALFFGRAHEETELKGFDETIFAENSNADERSWEELVEDYISVRNATINLFKGFRESDLMKYGSVNHQKISVRAAGFIICGHEIHHREIIRERYLNESFKG
ncbi:MAG TPA: DinB family protein [Flavobacteriaceae bacterium]|nr:DinB family protein [Flavobacteriaceae bacterium]